MSDRPARRPPSAFGTPGPGEGRTGGRGPTRRRTALGPALSTLLAFAAAGGPAAAAPPAARAQPTVENAPVEVVVPAPRTPQVKSTFPAPGAVVPGGDVILKIVFDQPMQPGSWSYGPASGGEFPSCLARPRLLPDGRTFVLLCSLALSARFALEINAAPDFASSTGRPAPPYTLRFATSGDETVSLSDALRLAGLTDSDDPIMSADAAAGRVEARRGGTAAVEATPAPAGSGPAGAPPRTP